MELKNLSSNWKRLQATLKTAPEDTATKSQVVEEAKRHGLKRKRLETATSQSERQEASTFKRTKRRLRMDQMDSKGGPNLPNQVDDVKSSADGELQRPSRPADLVNAGLSTTTELGRYIAIDCEMVGVGPNPDQESALARVSVVNFNGDQVYDSFVHPKEQVTDWRTHVSGVTSKHMIQARSLEEVQRDISKILEGRILIGHAIRNDLDALMLSHPKRDIRDTARHPPFRKYAGGGSPKLKILAAELLGLDIQGGEHSSIEDARACMLLFRQEKPAFEQDHAKKWPARVSPAMANGDAGEGSKGKKKKKKKRKK